MSLSSPPSLNARSGSSLSPGTRNALTLGGLFLLALLIQVVAFNRRIGPYDEFLSLYGADRVLHGGIPYRDFWTMYGPAQFYVLALFFKVFGTSVLTGRIYDALIRAGIACACFALTRMLAPARWAFAAFAAVALWLACLYYPAYNFPVYPAMLASLISCLFFSRFLRESSYSRSLFLAGLFVSIATIFRHDSGFYIFLAELFMLAWITGLSRRPGDPLLTLLRSFGRRVLLYFAGVGLIAGPVYGAVLLQAGFKSVFYQLFYVPAVIYPKVRSLPFLPAETLEMIRHPFSWDGRLAVESLIVLFPILAILSAFLCLFTSRRSRIFPTTWQRRLFSLLLLLASLFFVKGLIRVGPVQLLQSIIVCLIVLAVLFGHLPQLGRINTLPLCITAGFLVLCTLPVLSQLASSGRLNLRKIVHSGASDSYDHLCHPSAGLSRGRCVVVEPEVASAVQEIERRSTPDQTIFIGDGRHDRIFWGDVRLYFLSGRGAVTRWYDLHPGVQTTLAIQNEIIDSLRQQNPQVIVLNSTWDDTVEPNQSQFSSGVTVLDDYIHGHYVQQAAYGKISILTPRQ